MKIPQPVCPIANSQIDAPIQTMGGPKGTKLRKKVSSARSMGAGAPAMANPIPATMPCAKAVPITP